jgi:tetratricopeptide (TPR) repeat protein
VLDTLYPQRSPSGTIAAIVRLTTPELAEWVKSGRFVESPDGERLVALPIGDEKERRSLADKALENEDGVAAIYLLAPRNEEEEANISLVKLGSALRMCFLPSESSKILREAIFRQSKDAQAWYELGRTKIIEREWLEAAEAMEKALEFGVIQEELARYYAGVARFHQEHGLRAENHFQRLMWYGMKDSEFQESARDFLETVRQNRDLRGRFGLEIGYDGSALGTSRKYSETEADLSTYGGHFYNGTLELQYFVSREESVAVSLHDHLGFKVYRETELADLGAMKNNLYLNIELHPKAEIASGVMLNSATGRIGFENTIVGGARSLETIYAEGGVGFGGVKWQPEVWFRHFLSIDPNPQHIYLLDPITGSPDSATDMSNAGRSLRLVVRPLVEGHWDLRSQLELGQRWSFRNVLNDRVVNGWWLGLENQARYAVGPRLAAIGDFNYRQVKQSGPRTAPFLSRRELGLGINYHQTAQFSYGGNWMRVERSGSREADVGSWDSVGVSSQWSF